MASSGALFYAALSGLLLSGVIALMAAAARGVAERRQSSQMRRRLDTIIQTRTRQSGPELSRSSTREGDWCAGLLARVKCHRRLQKLLVSAAYGGTMEQLIRRSLLAAGIAGITAGIVTRGAIAAILGAALVTAAIPTLRLYVRAIKRRHQFDQQLPDALDFMSRALRAGHGLTMAFQMVAEELPEPISGEFRQVFDEINFGTSFQEAFGGLAYRIESQDLGFFVVGVLIQRETGGNLSELLHNLSTTIRERFKLQGKVRTLAAEGKYSGILLGSLPAIMGFVLSLINPAYMSELWDTHTGQKWLTIGVCLMIAGFAWMWKIAQIRV